MYIRSISALDVENTIRNIFRIRNIHNVNIIINNCNTSIASIIGLNLNDFGLYSYVNLNLNFNKIQEYDDDELLFILSHECAHIYYNHVLQNIFWFGLENLIRGKNNENGVYVDFIKLGTAFLNSYIFNEFVPINKAHVKSMELEADEFAVKCITMDVNSAIRCLKNLCNYDLQRESHVWETSQFSFPIMTMGERIEELKKKN
jgi:threonyl-tRNA synthetase